MGIEGVDGQRELRALEVGWIYYHTMLNAVHVNVVVSFCVGFLFLVSMALAGRSSPGDRRRWIVLLVASQMGCASYICGVVPRYIQLHQEVVFDPKFFERWEMVIAARLVTILCITFCQV